jgi:hypothetical protein
MKTLEGLIRGMGQWTDLDKALEESGLTAAEALAVLEGEQGQRQMAARRELARIHAELIALRFRPLAASKLCGMLQEEKAELRLKAALAVLEIAADAADSRRPEDGATNTSTGDEVDDEEADTELMMAVAEVIAQRRRVELMGAPPRVAGGKADGHAAGE